MKVFLSWSKPRSQKVAELLSDWIPCVLQSVDPWVSSQNIEDGELWFNAIQSQVAQIINGIICLTKENVNEPWILFEAGGLAKGLEKSRIYILLIDLSSSDFLLSPLAGFNHTKCTEEGIRKLIHIINGRTSRPIKPSIVDQVFDKFWPDFKANFDEIIKETKTSEKPNQEPESGALTDDKVMAMLEEVLKSVRLINQTNSLIDKRFNLVSNGMRKLDDAIEDFLTNSDQKSLEKGVFTTEDVLKHLRDNYRMAPSEQMITQSMKRIFDKRNGLRT